MSHEIVEKILALSKADATVAIAAESSNVNLRWANNTLTTNGATRSKNIVVISIIGKSFGVRSATSANSETLEVLVRASEADARSASEADDYNELPAGPVASDFFDPAEYTHTDVLAGFAKELGEVLDTSRNNSNSLFGFAEYETVTTWMGTTSGTRLRHTQPGGTVQWNAKNGKPGGSVWHGQHTRDFTDVSVTATSELLAKRLSWCNRFIDLPAGRYETLMPPATVADLLTYTYWSASGRDAAEGRNVFSKPGGGTRIGEQIGPSGLRMFSDPYDVATPTTPWVAAASSSAESSVFDNGLELKATDWISDGKLANLVNSRASAAEQNVAATPFIYNLALESTSNPTLSPSASTSPSASSPLSLDAMIANTERGLLLTCLWYIRPVDPQTLLLTGLTRDGVFLIEDGKIAGAVNNFRFNESPIDLLTRCSEIGASVPTMSREWGDNFPLTRMPTLRIPDFNMSSVSPAS